MASDQREIAIDELHERIEKLESDLTEAKLELQQRYDSDWQIDEMETALREVQYWMLGPLVYGMPMRDPRKILLIVERALDS